MTKKHFIDFAYWIKLNVDTANGSQSTVERQNMLTTAQDEFEMVCRVASKHNLSFDRNRFRTACGLD